MGVIPVGATATVRSCRPFAFLPKSPEELLTRLQGGHDLPEHLIYVRAARRMGLWAEAAKAFERRRAELKERCAPARREVLVSGRHSLRTGLGAAKKWTSRKVFRMFLKHLTAMCLCV